MSVIIRLQNLPWSANALDVRNFFKGLSIPDGGVHIVGGEMGDAFIAFSTDEDARQAMMLNGGKIKEVQVSLLLSSRAEMQKVIEEARRTTVSFMQLSAQSATASPPTIVPPKVTAPSTVPTQQPQPQPPVISLSGFLAQNLNQQKAQVIATPSIYSEIPGLGFLTGSAGMFQPNAPAAGLFSALNAQSYGAGSANSAFTQLSEQLKKAAEAEKNAAAKNVIGAVPATATTGVAKKDSNDRGFRRSRSSSRERDRRRSNRDRSRSRSRDRGSRRRSGRSRSRSRERSRRRSGRSRSRSRERRSRSRSRSRDRSRDREIKGEKVAKQRTSRFNDRNDSKPTNTIEPPQTPFVNPWSTSIQQNLLKLASNTAAQPNPGVSPNAFAVKNEQTQFSGIGPSYQSNVLPAVNYGSFEASKPISNEHLSKLQELHSRRDPRVFQTNMTAKQQSNNGNGNLRQQTSLGYTDSTKPSIGYADSMSTGQDDRDSQSVKVSNLENSTGYGEIRRFFFGQSISSNGIKMINDENGKRTGVAYIRFLRKDGKRYAMSRDGMKLKRTAVKIEPISDREFEEATDSYRPNYDDNKSSWNDSKKDNKNDVIEIRDDPNDKVIKCGSLVIPNLPNMTTELDLMRIFSDYTIVEVLIIKNYRNRKQLDGYVKFHRLDDARRACESTHQHFVRNKRVFVKPCSDIEYDAAKNECEAPESDDGAPEQSNVGNNSVQVILDDSKESKGDEDDRMDVAEDEQEQEVKQNKLLSDNDVTPKGSIGYLDEGQSWEIEAQQNPPQQSTSRDPRSALASGLYQQPPKPDQPISNFGSFGADINRDPRRRPEFMAQKNDGNQEGLQSDVSRESFENSRSNYNSLQSLQPPRFSPQGPPPPIPMANNRFEQPPKNSNNKFNQDGNDRTCYVLITNLEYGLKESNIQEFLEKEGYNPKNAQVIRNAYGRSSGECLVEFETCQEAEETFRKNACRIGERKAFFKQLGKIQLEDVMQRLNQTQRESFQNFQNRFGSITRPTFGGENFGNSFGNTNLGDFRVNNFSGNSNGSSFGSDKIQNNYQNSFNEPAFKNSNIQEQNEADSQTGLTQQGELSEDMQENANIVTAPEEQNHSDEPNDDQNTDEAFAQSEPKEPNDNIRLCNQPMRGSILALGNLPFRAPNEEIVDFFKEYTITIEDVKRRYLPDGRATGDAMVRFQTASDAQRALDSHIQRRIGGRNVRMWILDN